MNAQLLVESHKPTDEPQVWPQVRLADEHKQAAPGVVLPAGQSRFSQMPLRQTATAPGVVGVAQSESVVQAPPQTGLLLQACPAPLQTPLPVGTCTPPVGFWKSIWAVPQEGVATLSVWLSFAPKVIV
jgi:hypothetical protein